VSGPRRERAAPRSASGARRRARAARSESRAGRRDDVWVLTCEHASAAVPRAYRGLGLRRAEILDHIGWDVGAHALQRAIAAELDAPWVASRWSRLLVDCNRDPRDPSLILAVSDGVRVPGNAAVSAAERRRRVDAYHAPYHRAVERAIARARAGAPQARLRLLALHSFTPVMRGKRRELEIGVLFDAYPHLAHRLGSALRRAGYRVRYNEPYSGLAGLIYSARRHGDAAGIEYVELEVNNALLREPRRIRRIARDVAAALRGV
jgi:predicted N-formylglutamate amidohydrolase